MAGILREIWALEEADIHRRDLVSATIEHCRVANALGRARYGISEHDQNISG